MTSMRSPVDTSDAMKVYHICILEKKKTNIKKGKTGSEVKWDIEQQLKDRNFTRSSKSVE